MQTWLPTGLRAVYYGPGSVKRVNEALQLVLGTSTQPRVFIVTGNSIANKTPIVKGVETLLGMNAHLATFANVSQHAPVNRIREAAAEVKRRKANVLLSIGGGSPIDSAKAIAYSVMKESGSSTAIPQIAIPTTLSAAEFTQTAGYTNENGDKSTWAGRQLAPQAVILDPELSTFTPQHLWLSSGIRALDHAVESLFRKDAQAPIRHLAIGSIYDLFTYLPMCYDHNGDVDVRTPLMTAAWQSMFPNRLTTPLGISHLLGHELGATYDIPHGVCSILTLSQTVRALVRAQKLSTDELHWLARAYDSLPGWAGRGPPISTVGAPQGGGDKALAFADAIDLLIKRLRLSTRLSSWDVPTSDFDKIAQHVASAMEKGDVTARLTADQIKTLILERI